MKRTIIAGAFSVLAMAAVAPASANPTDDVHAALLKFAALSSYEMTFGTGARTGTLDFVKPDAMHVTMGPVEMIRIRKATYVKQPPRGWMKIADVPAAGPAEMADRIREIANKPNGLSVTDLGMKNVDGETLHAYRVTQRNGSPSICYVARDGLPHRFQGERADSVVRLSKFNAVPAIRAPI